MLLKIREQFRELMGKIGVPMAPQATATSFLKGKEIAQEFGFPLVIRSSYTLVVQELRSFMMPEDFDELLRRGLEASPIHEVMIDKAMMGWKEYELELLEIKMITLLLFVLSKIWIQWEFIQEIPLQ